MNPFTSRIVEQRETGSVKPAELQPLHHAPIHAPKKWADPTCPKCSIRLADKMMYCCQEPYCPCNLN